MTDAAYAPGAAPALDPNVAAAYAGAPAGVQPAPLADPNASTEGAAVVSQPSAPEPAAPVVDVAGLAAALAPLLAGQAAPAPMAALEPAPTSAQPLMAAGLDALQIGEALIAHQAIPRRQAKALALMGIAAVVPGLAHAFGTTPNGLVPYLNDGAIALAFLAAAIGDFTGLLKGKVKGTA